MQLVLCLIFVQCVCDVGGLDLSHCIGLDCQFIPQGHRHEASAFHSMLVYFPVLAGTSCVFSQTDGQTELTSVALYIPRLFTRLKTVTHKLTHI